MRHSDVFHSHCVIRLLEHPFLGLLPARKPCALLRTSPCIQKKGGRKEGKWGPEKGIFHSEEITVCKIFSHSLFSFSLEEDFFSIFLAHPFIWSCLGVFVRCLLDACWASALCLEVRPAIIPILKGAWSTEAGVSMLPLLGVVVRMSHLWKMFTIMLGTWWTPCKCFFLM